MAHGSLLDEVLPEFHFVERHSVGVRAGPEAVYAALLAFRSSASPLWRVLFLLRALPGLLAALARRERLGWPPPGEGAGARSPFLEEARAGGFVVLAEAPGQEIVLGLVGRFWRLGGDLAPIPDAAGFAAFDRPDYARAAINFRVEPAPEGGTRLSTETRAELRDRPAQRRFRLYWALVRPFSGWLRTDALRRIRSAAEHSQVTRLTN